MSRVFRATFDWLPGERWLFMHSETYRAWRIRIAFRQVRSAIVRFSVTTAKATAAIDKMQAALAAFPDGKDPS